MYKTLFQSIAFVCAFLVFANSARATDEKSIKRFRDAMVALAPDVDPAEAEAISVISHNTSRRLAREWGVVGPSVFQNFLIHVGARQKGFCFQYARGIGERLKELNLKTIVLHWGASGPGTVGEHNVVVVSARGQPFREGYIIDGWRNAGRLCWWPVSKDSSYVWREDPRETAWLQDYGLAQPKPARTATTQRPVSSGQKSQHATAQR
ncbi:MAG: hypothetical protein JWO45_1208 [Spartobacteria bacterium]|nr:hypothetical protein [Spartobacteria bacterium]